MSTRRRILASRNNGAKSRGPRTPEGKRRSAQNALRHGLLAKCIVLQNESRKGFHQLLTQHLERLAPADGVEFGMVEEMAAAYWRMRRAWAIETRILDDAIESQNNPDELGRIASAFASLAASPQLSLLHRYETRLHKMYQRGLQNLLLLRSCETNLVPFPDTAETPPPIPETTDPEPQPDTQCTPPPSPPPEPASSTPPTSPAAVPSLRPSMACTRTKSKNPATRAKSESGSKSPRSRLRPSVVSGARANAFEPYGRPLYVVRRIAAAASLASLGVTAHSAPLRR